MNAQADVPVRGPSSRRRERLATACVVGACLIELLTVWATATALRRSEWFGLVLLAPPALGVVGFALGLRGLHRGTMGRTRALWLTVLGASTLAWPWVFRLAVFLWAERIAGA